MLFRPLISNLFLPHSSLVLPHWSILVLLHAFMCKREQYMYVYAYTDIFGYVRVCVEGIHVYVYVHMCYFTNVSVMFLFFLQRTWVKKGICRKVIEGGSSILTKFQPISNDRDPFCVLEYFRSVAKMVSKPYAFE